MATLIVNGESIHVKCSGTSFDGESMYPFTYTSRADWDAWPLPDGTVGPLYFDITFDCTYYVELEEDYAYVKVDKLKINKVSSKNPEHQAYFDEHLREFELVLYDEFEDDDQLIDEFLSDIRFEF